MGWVDAYLLRKHRNPFRRGTSRLQENPVERRRGERFDRHALDHDEIYDFIEFHLGRTSGVHIGIPFNEISHNMVLIVVRGEDEDRLGLDRSLPHTCQVFG